jgi:hypothetical protein
MCALGDRFIAIVLALGLIAASMTGARADPYGDALLAFTADNFDQSGNPAANGGLCQATEMPLPEVIYEDCHNRGHAVLSRQSRKN